MEMLVVLTIIGLLMGLSVLPYGDFMNRARLSNAVDHISQEWILAHKEVRNGQEFNPINPSSSATREKKFATEVFVFTAWANFVEKFYCEAPRDNSDYTKAQFDINCIDTINKDDKNIYKKIDLERNVKILSFNPLSNDGLKKITPTNVDEKLYYAIVPPKGEWKFYANNKSELSDVEKKIIIGYEGAENAISNAKEILLRTYLR